MPGFNNQATSDAYTDACTIRDVPESNGGTFDVSGANVLLELQIPPFGSDRWKREQATRPGSGLLLPGTMGIRFRSAVAGQPATVTADIAGKAEPVVQVANTASAATAPSNVITGIVASNGTVTAGSGFSVNRTGPGVYVVTFTTPFAATPVVLVNEFTPSVGNVTRLSSISASGFTVTTNFGGAGNDDAFNFTVTAVV